MSILTQFQARLRRNRKINPKVAELLEAGETYSNNHWRRAAWMIKKSRLIQQARSECHAINN